MSSSRSPSNRRLSGVRLSQSPSRRKSHFINSLQTESVIDSWSAIATKMDANSQPDVNSAQEEVAKATKEKLYGLLKEIENTQWMYSGNSFA
mmetsp:Transcript_3977/g.6211  ORF Transcript_3977/g.6211 Transcript_3977/m.6211 type:complete len:92 (+) Transcript_3977:40-315(+)